MLKFLAFTFLSLYYFWQPRKQTELPASKLVSISMHGGAELCVALVSGQAGIKSTEMLPRSNAVGSEIYQGVLLMLLSKIYCTKSLQTE